VRPRAIAVIHSEAMVAEGLTAALSRYPCIVPLGYGTTAQDAARLGERADAMAIESSVPDSSRLALQLGVRGVRVVLIGDEDGEEDGFRVPTGASVAALAQALVPALADMPRRSSPLTKREQEILDLVANGLAAKQVGRHLGISAKTVEQHKSHIFAKLGVPNQTAAVSLMLGEAVSNGGSGWTRLST
jgi:DNA-binding CsgD family transcriptional regulator